MSQGLALKDVLEKHGVNAPVEILQSETASIQNAGRLHRADIDFGYMAANWIGKAKRGEPPFEQPIDLRMVAPMNAGPMFFITLKNSSIRTVADLRGKRVSVGAERSGVHQHAKSIFGALKIAFTDFEPLYMDFATGAQALASGMIDAQLQCPIPNTVMTKLDREADIRVVPYAPEDLATVLRECPIYQQTIMRKGALRGLTEDVAQPAVVNVLVTHARTDADMVRQVAAIVYKHADELVRLNALYTGLPELFLPLKTKGQGALEFESVPLHEGAVQAYREADLI